MKRFYSIGVIISCMLIYILIHQTVSKSRGANPFSHDQIGYYSYLPALFIYQDLDFSFLKKKGINIDKKIFTVPINHKKGQEVDLNRYSTGTAILLSPFFGLAHLQASFSSSLPNGYSKPYQQFMFVGQFFYLFLALLLLRNILIRYFDDKTTAWTIAIIALGTNLTHYVLFEPVMSHVYSFFLFSLSLWLTIKWLEKPQQKILLLLGLVFGILVNTRVTNIVYIFVLLFWGVHSLATLQERIKLAQQYWKTLAISILLALSIFIPQLLYWQTVTGYWIVNSYGKQGGTFFWADPMVGEVLWGYKKGWLLYSPLMLFALIGLGFLYKQLSSAFWGILLYIILNLYIISCWWCWWYGGSFGMRALIESMVPLSLALAAFLQWIFQSKIRQIPVLFLIFLGIGLNFFQTHQYSHYCIDSFGMTRKSYWAVFGQFPPLSPEVYKEFDDHLLGVYMNKMTQKERDETKTYNERSEKE